MASAKDLIVISSSVLVIFAAGFALGVLLSPQFETKPAVISAPDLPGVPDSQENIGVDSRSNLGGRHRNRRRAVSRGAGH
jgi:hypothetical protein